VGHNNDDAGILRGARDSAMSACGGRPVFHEPKIHASGVHIITPWVIRGGIATTATAGTIASNVAVGAVAVIVGVAATSVAALSRRSA
jgi:hypothetical protein